MKTNIVLLCAGGMSTSILMNKMRAAAQEIDFACEVNAYGVAQAPRVVPEADIVLIGPQVRFTIDRLKVSYPDKKIFVIDMKDYGTMNGPKIIENVIEILGVSL